MYKHRFYMVIITLLLMSPVYCQNLDYSKFGIETVECHIPIGLNVGDKAPDFSGYDQTGKFIESKKLLENGPIILFFYRGNWCPVCSRYLRSYQDSLNLITDQNVSLIAVTPESIENVEQTVKFNNLTFTVIYDCQEKIMKDYDVMFKVTEAYQNLILTSLSTDIAKNNGREAAHLPVPATYIVNRNGYIVAVQFNPNYWNRASVDWIIRNLGKAF